MSNARLRIVHLLSGDQWAGAEVMAFHLLTHLHKRTPDVSALCLNEGELSKRLRAAGVSVQVLPEASLSFPQIVRQAARLLRGDRVDVLHSHRYKEHYLATLLSAWTGARLVATVHGLPEPARSRRTWYALQTGLTFRLLRSRFDVTTAVSAAMKEVLVRDQRFRPERVRTVVNGIAVPEATDRSSRAGSLHVGSVGRLVPVKRFEVFVEVAATVRRTFPDVRFSILGDGPDRDMINAKVRSLGIQQWFQIVEPMSDPAPYYRSLDVYMNTSESEGLPLSVLEAMAAGVPVVAGAIGGIPEIVTHDRQGFLVSSLRAEEYAERCGELLAHAELRASFGSQGRARVEEEFSAAVMAQRYFDLYEDVTEATHAQAKAPDVEATREQL